jgi:5-methyltetrahydrofolate--homocysteine methyltransferase
VPPVPADLRRQVVEVPSLSELWPYVDINTLLSKHLGVQGEVKRKISEGDPKTAGILSEVRRVFDLAEQEKLIRARGVFQFFPAAAVGDEIRILAGSTERFAFPRQAQAPYLCLADYLRPLSGPDGGGHDYLGLMVVTAGIGVRQAAQAMKEQGAYLHSHMLQALALELAEALAQRAHEQMRALWGIVPEQGMRVSPGYAVCPNLADQVKIMRLLNAEELGITLTEDYMLDPEASVSALVFAHPDARYFTLDRV